MISFLDSPSLIRRFTEFLVLGSVLMRTMTILRGTRAEPPYWTVFPPWSRRSWCLTRAASARKEESAGEASQAG